MGTSTSQSFILLTTSLGMADYVNTITGDLPGYKLHLCCLTYATIGYYTCSYSVLFSQKDEYIL